MWRQRRAFDRSRVHWQSLCAGTCLAPSPLVTATFIVSQSVSHLLLFISSSSSTVVVTTGQQDVWIGQSVSHCQSYPLHTLCFIPRPSFNNPHGRGEILKMKHRRRKEGGGGGRSGGLAIRRVQFHLFTQFVCVLILSGVCRRDGTIFTQLIHIEMRFLRKLSIIAYAVIFNRIKSSPPTKHSSLSVVKPVVPFLYLSCHIYFYY